MHPRDILEYTQDTVFIGVTEQRAMERFRHALEQLHMQ